MKVAVIPARGGSRRIPRKNIRAFAGRPIIAHSIAAARASGVFNRILVSTDDEEIAAIAREAGAETPFVRPAELADAHTGTNAVVRHAIQWLLADGAVVEYACCIYATAPLLQPRYLRLGLERLVASGRSFAFSVTSFPAPVQRALRVNADGGIEPLWPEHAARRSQDLEPAFHDAAQFYWGRAQAFVDQVALFSPASIGIVLPRHLVQDIDTEEDWLRAELMFRALEARSPAA
ncbi:MAG: pseudaminic acid cytidylyltransferase [Burkholderiales bacterium]|nr:MAG: pseudaminic acid cytidylyltransferase [Burkholderiales bacterium]